MEGKNGTNKRKPLGEILLEKYIITHEMLDLALERQQKEGGKYLGQIFLDMGVPQEQLNEILEYFQRRRKIGDILIEDKTITPSQLEEALKKQREEQPIRKPVGRILMELGYIDYEQYMSALSRHFLMQVVSLKNFTPSKNLQRMIGEGYARKNKILVLEDSDEKLKLAFPEPSLAIMEDIRRFARLEKRIEFFLAKPSEVDPWLDKLYPDRSH